MKCRKIVDLWIGALVSVYALSIAYGDDFEGSIMTVWGAISVSELGKTLSHEHILVDFIGAEESGYHRWDRDDVILAVLPRLEDVRKLGYKSLFECTPAFLGRDPVLLKRLSELSGIQLITNTGYYGARTNKYVPKNIQSWSVDRLAKKWIQEFREGIEDTGIRPGFIKTSVDREDRLSAFHESLIRAACRAHLETGMTIASHTGASPVVFEIARILQEEGVAPEAFIWVHATRDTSANQIRAARMGLWVSIDNLRDNANLLRANVEGLVALKDADLLNRVLVSQDAGWYRPGGDGGGDFALYTYVEQSLVPALRKVGFEQRDIDRLLIDNPGRAYALRVRSLGGD